MQSYYEIASTDTVSSSLAFILNNDKTIMSSSSGTAFPTSNLQVGMLCFRTDTAKLYQLKDATPTWVLLLDLSGVGGYAVATLATTAVNISGGVAGAIPYQSAGGTTALSAAGTAGQVLTSGGAGAPTWVSPSTMTVGTAAACSGNAATATTAAACSGNATTATTASSCSGNAATATTANSLNTANNYQVNSIGVGTPGSATTGEIRATNNITAYYSSDAKFKENVRNIPDALNKVRHIGGKLFDWTDEYIESHGGEDGYFVRKEDFGVIANDVRDVFPLAVREREDGSLAVDYSKLCALSFAAMVEMACELKAVKDELAMIRTAANVRG